MNLASKLQDVYFDAVRLSEELGTIPEACECGDALAHLRGDCRCGGTANSAAGRRPSDRGCLAHLDRLHTGVAWLREDLRRGLRGVSPADLAGRPAARLFAVQAAVDRLAAALEAAETTIVGLAPRCPHGALTNLSAAASSIGARAEALNREL